MYSFRINELHFRGSDVTYCPKKKITVLIGPNNSGKSKSLREIRSEILGHQNNYGQETEGSVIFDKIVFNLPNRFKDLDDAYLIEDHVIRTSGGWRVREQCNQGLLLGPNGYQLIPGNMPVYSPSEDWRPQSERAFDAIGCGQSNDEIMKLVGPLFVDYSGVDDRLLISAGQQARGVMDNEYNALSAALDADPDCLSFCKEARELFHRDVVLDGVTSRQSIVPRTSDDFSGYRGSNDAKKRISALIEAKPLSREGDGLRGFASLFLSIAGSGKPILLIDEPEAFLHPPHALRTGELIARRVMESSEPKQVFIATHSSMLLQGLLHEASDDIAVVRLTRVGDKTQARVLENKLIKKQVDRADYSPLYLDGLFSSSVILVESPRDASVYGALANAACDNFAPIFVPTNGKDRIADLLKFYRAAGVECGAIIDFDIVDDKNKFNKLLDTAKIEEKERPKLRDIRTRLERHLCSHARSAEGETKGPGEQKGDNGNFKNHVTDDMPPELEKDLDNMLEKLGMCGICVIRSGELESIFDGHPVRHIAHSHKSETWFFDAMKAIKELDVKQLAEGKAAANIIDFLRARNARCR